MPYLVVHNLKKNNYAMSHFSHLFSTITHRHLKTKFAVIVLKYFHNSIFSQKFKGIKNFQNPPSYVRYSRNWLW